MFLFDQHNSIMFSVSLYIDPQATQRARTGGGRSWDPTLPNLISALTCGDRSRGPTHPKHRRCTSTQPCHHHPGGEEGGVGTGWRVTDVSVFFIKKWFLGCQFAMFCSDHLCQVCARRMPRRPEQDSCDACMPAIQSLGDHKGGHPRAQNCSNSRNKNCNLFCCRIFYFRPRDYWPGVDKRRIANFSGGASAPPDPP